MPWRVTNLVTGHLAVCTRTHSYSYKQCSTAKHHHSIMHTIILCHNDALGGVCISQNDSSTCCTTCCGSTGRHACYRSPLPLLAPQGNGVLSPAGKSDRCSRAWQVLLVGQATDASFLPPCRAGILDCRRPGAKPGVCCAGPKCWPYAGMSWEAPAAAPSAQQVQVSLHEGPGTVGARQASSLSQAPCDHGPQWRPFLTKGKGCHGVVWWRDCNTP